MKKSFNVGIKAFASARLLSSSGESDFFSITMSGCAVKKLQMLELLKNLDAYLDYSYDEAREKFAEYITIHGIKRSDVDTYIRKYPLATFKFYYELGLDHVLA